MMQHVLLEQLQVHAIWRQLEPIHYKVYNFPYTEIIAKMYLSCIMYSTAVTISGQVHCWSWHIWEYKFKMTLKEIGWNVVN